MKFDLMMVLDKKNLEITKIMTIHPKINMNVKTYFMAKKKKNILQVKHWAPVIILTAEEFGWAVPDTLLHMCILCRDKQDITGETKAVVCKQSHYMMYDSSSTNSP